MKIDIPKTVTANVVPTNDLKEHKNGVECWCKPKVEGSIIVHNAMDEREKYEKGERLLS